MPCLVLEAATTLVLLKLEDFHSVTAPDEAPVQEEVEVQHHPHHHLILCCQVNLVDMFKPEDIFLTIFLIPVFSIGLFWFCSVSFLYSGVYFLWFIFNCSLTQFISAHSFWAKILRAKRNYLCPIMYLCAKRASFIVQPKDM